VEQICTEFKVRALKFHPDKNAGDKTAEETFQKLNVSAITVAKTTAFVRASFSFIYTYLVNI